MKISELIKRLEELQEEHGDLEVGVYESENSEDYLHYQKAVKHVTTELDDVDKTILRVMLDS